MTVTSTLALGKAPLGPAPATPIAKVMERTAWTSHRFPQLLSISSSSITRANRRMRDAKVIYTVAILGRWRMPIKQRFLSAGMSRRNGQTTATAPIA
jgi:hypothetical protein